MFLERTDAGVAGDQDQGETGDGRRLERRSLGFVDGADPVGHQPRARLRNGAAAQRLRFLLETGSTLLIDDCVVLHFQLLLNSVGFLQVFDLGRGVPVAVTGVEYFRMRPAGEGHALFGVLVTTPTKLYQFHSVIKYRCRPYDRSSGFYRVLPSLFSSFSVPAGWCTTIRCCSRSSTRTSTPKVGLPSFTEFLSSGR